MPKKQTGYTNQLAEWQVIYEKLCALMAPLGTENLYGEGQYFVGDECYGGWTHLVRIDTLDICSIELIRSLHAVIREYPRWRLFVSFPVDELPDMSGGLVLSYFISFSEIPARHLPKAYKYLAHPENYLTHPDVTPAR